ncbi:hypothetical protein PENTCL1PPCAC_26084, partial [Pristionchus entomophagus]
TSSPSSPLLPFVMPIAVKLEKLKNLQRKFMEYEWDVSQERAEIDLLGDTYRKAYDVMVELTENGPAHAGFINALALFKRRRERNKANDEWSFTREIQYGLCEALELCFASLAYRATGVEFESEETNVMAVSDAK